MFSHCKVLFELLPEQQIPYMCSNFGAFPVLHWVLLAITTEVKNRMTWSIVLSNNLRWQGVLFEIQPREERRQSYTKFAICFKVNIRNFYFIAVQIVN